MAYRYPGSDIARVYPSLFVAAFVILEPTQFTYSLSDNIATLTELFQKENSLQPVRLIINRRSVVSGTGSNERTSEGVTRRSTLSSPFAEAERSRRGGKVEPVDAYEKPCASRRIIDVVSLASFRPCRGRIERQPREYGKRGEDPPSKSASRGLSG